MALQRPLSKTLACQNCQRWILRSFIAGIGGSMPIRLTSILSQQRTFAGTSRRRNEARERIQKEEKIVEHPLNEINEEDAQIARLESASELEQPAQEHLPWYLQVQQPIQRIESPLAARQKLPELPEYPPPLLQPLLEHVSVEMGMDDLSLLDLRSLDPPPALGSNLIMIVGTARSEKHLHVSADRLCRWLRSQYKLRPYADGLLGRNELKLKMRRKAKRSRLLSAVGAKATAATEMDDGIRTGWVCVNVGRVQGGELPNQENLQRPEGFVGFGTTTNGSNIVVQLMTEEKRGEIDLENLWTAIVNTANRKMGKESATNDETSSEQAVKDSDIAPELDNTTSSPGLKGPSTSTTYFPSVNVSNHNAGQRLRAYHTTAKRALTQIIDQSGLDLNGFRTSDPIPMNAAEEQVSSFDISTLTSLLTELKSMDPEQALNALGNDLFIASQPLKFKHLVLGSRDKHDAETVSSTFLKAFYDAIPTFPGPEHWHMHIELLAHARSLGHPDVHTGVLTAQLNNMQIAGLTPDERTFKLVIKSALAPMGTAMKTYGVDYHPPDGKMRKVFTVLEDMETCGYDPVAPDILEMLYQACVGMPQHQRTCELSSVLPQLGAARLRRHVHASDWPAFWRTWRSYPQRFLPRSVEMYKVLFDAIGDGRLESSREVVDVLRTYLPEMEREEPAVVIERHMSLAQAGIRALEFVEPRLRDEGDEKSVSKEWRRWYERCIGVLKQVH